MNSHYFTFLFTSLFVATTSCVVADPNEPTGERLKSFVTNYCVSCHTVEDGAGGVSLEEFSTDHLKHGQPWDTTVWEKMVRRLRSRQMPPPDADRPDEDEYLTIVSVFEKVLDDTAAAHPQPGTTDPVRRLNRAEYQNSVRDLLRVNIDASEFLPADQSGHGFDNVTLGELPPLLLQRYIAAAEKIARLAVGGRERSPGGRTVRLPADRSQDSHVAGLPLGTRGGILFEHQFPQTGEYEIQLRLMRDRDERIEGLTEDHDLDVLLDRAQIHRFAIAAPKSGKGWDKDFSLVDANLKKRFHVAAGPHNVGVTFPQKFASLSEINRQPFDASFNRHRHPRQSPALYEVSIVGPFEPEGPGDTPSRKWVYGEFLDGNQDAAAARQILQRLLRLAYRRDVTDDDLMVPMKFFSERFASDGFDAGMESALSAVLVNPHFLFRVEKQPEGTSSGRVYQVSDFELASRLSYLLWSSGPDEELLSLAAASRLHIPEVLQSQVIRMLADGRSQSLVDNFVAQWLYLRNLESFKPDMRLFTDFDDNLRIAMRRETELLFDDIVKNDRSVLDLISTKTTFLNERLARHYGIAGVVGSHFRPVEMSAASHRGGILRHGSVLAVTSYATRTSPTLRGNWILKNILGTPPPPPPANVPALKENTSQVSLTVRERLAEHRANPACASCHNLMDPVGFAMENFDAVGRWRVFEGEQIVDSSGSMPDGSEIDSVESLEQGIVNRPEMLVGTLTEKLLTFALGRGVEPEDGPTVREIVRGSAKSSYSFSSIVTGIVQSTPFQKRVVE